MSSRGFIELLRLADLADARKTGRYDLQETQWSGIVFEVAGQRMVAPMGEINEILAVPDLTPVPLVESWMLGVANVRGRLLPLADLAGFLNLESRELRMSKKKVMVIDQENFFSGILVDQVHGIQSFNSTHYQPDSLPIESPFARFNHGKFRKGQEEWFVFRPSLLAQDAKFADAAASQ